MPARLRYVLGAAVALSACADNHSSTSTIHEGAMDAGPCNQGLALPEVGVSTDARPMAIIGGDDAHPCSWQVPALVPNEDVSKRRLEFVDRFSRASIVLDQVEDAAACASGSTFQFYETAGTDLRYVLCRPACDRLTQQAYEFYFLRACK